MTIERRRRPASHPVVQRVLSMQEIRSRTDSAHEIGRLPADEAEVREQLTYQIEGLARFVDALPDRPLSVHQRRLLRTISDELTRRAGPAPIEEET